MCGGLLSSVPSLTSCSSLQLLHARPPRLLRAHCTCTRHQQELGEGGKEEEQEQPCSHQCDRVPHVSECARTSSVSCGVTHGLQLPPTTPCVPAKAGPCLLHMSATRSEAGGGWEGVGPWATMLTAVRPSATCEQVCVVASCAVWRHSRTAAPSSCSMHVCQRCLVLIAHVRDAKRG